jgi:hypothetical protein
MWTCFEGEPARKHFAAPASRHGRLVLLEPAPRTVERVGRDQEHPVDPRERRIQGPGIVEVQTADVDPLGGQVGELFGGPGRGDDPVGRNVAGFQEVRITRWPR